MVKIKYVGYLAELAGEREVEIEIRGLEPVRSLVDPGVDLKEVIVLVNGKPSDLDKPVGGDDEVVVLPMASGG